MVLLNVKRVKWLLFKRVKCVRTTLTEWKSLSKRVKIIPKRVKITPKRVRITPKTFTFWGAHWRTARNKRAVPQWAPPKSESHSFGVILTLFGVIFTRFGMIFTRFESDFHSVRVVLTHFTLLKSNHFTLFTLREYSKFINFTKTPLHIHTSTPPPHTHTPPPPHTHTKHTHINVI